MAPTFRNDYSVLAHPRILEALQKYSRDIHSTYGLDLHSKNAAESIKKVFGAEEGEVYFLSGGTQTNLVFISACLRHYEGIIAPDSGHISVHETAAIEGNGYKIITLPNIGGKITAAQIEEALKPFDNEHMVKPRMVYLSNSTEFGTIYCKAELEAISKVCRKNGLYLYLDGARLGNALTSKENDLDPTGIGKYCDAFYVGGTKNGMMIGEALVVQNKALQKDFRYHIKNKGAMLSKGYLIGIEFEESFRDGLYFELAKHSNEMAEQLGSGLKKLGIEPLAFPTNQVFACFPKLEAEDYIAQFGLEKWSEEGKSIMVRFVTSFATTKKDVEEVLSYIGKTHR